MKQNEEGNLHLIVFVHLLRNITNFHYSNALNNFEQTKKYFRYQTIRLFSSLDFPPPKCPSDAYDCT